MDSLDSYIYNFFSKKAPAFTTRSSKALEEKVNGKMVILKKRTSHF